MAEIEIEKKKPIWPWILLVLIILAILYFVVFADDDNTADDMDDTNIEQMDETSMDDQDNTADWDENDSLTSAEDVSGYITYVNDKSKMGVDHVYTNNALMELVNAVEAKANELHVDVSDELEEVRNDAIEITQNPEAKDHAGTIKEAGTKIADVLENLKDQKFPELSEEVEQVKTAAQQIDPNVQTLKQKDKINSFFMEAADVLEKMS